MGPASAARHHAQPRPAAIAPEREKCQVPTAVITADAATRECPGEPASMVRSPAAARRMKQVSMITDSTANALCFCASDMPDL